MNDRPLVYLILGATGSGRRELLADLIDGGLGADDRAAVLLPADEAAVGADGRIPAAERWAWTGAGRIEVKMPVEVSHVFFLVEGRRNPVDQIEAFKVWLEASGGELARVLCVVNCQLAEKHHPLQAWFDACVHFSDVVLLTHREGVANKWMSGFLGRYKAQFLPCLFELVKRGRVNNPALILEVQARRMSHVFDAEPDWVFKDPEDGEIDEEEETEGEQEVTATGEEDPYLARLPGGRRAKVLPDIAPFLAGEKPAKASGP